MATADMEVLSPQVAAGIAKQVYESRTESPKFVAEQFSLIIDNKYELMTEMDGVAGPRPLDWSNGFGYIARGRDDKSAAILATRGTATMLDLWTDLNGAFAAASVSNPGIAVVVALKWIMKFLGRNAESIKEASMAVIRWCLSTFLSIVGGMARRAMYHAMYFPRA